MCQVHDSLVAKEEARRQSPSGLRILARYDVSAFSHGEGFHFLVNEVERTHTMALFMGANEKMSARLLASLSQILAAAVILNIHGDKEMIYKGHENFPIYKDRRTIGR